MRATCSAFTDRVNTGNNNPQKHILLKQKIFVVTEVENCSKAIQNMLLCIRKTGYTVERKFILPYSLTESARKM